MSSIVWQSPAPSSAFLRGVSVVIRPQREIALAFGFEDHNEEMCSAELVFHDVVHYRITYLAALRAEVIHQAYDRLVELPESYELREVMGAIKDNGGKLAYQHYRICFDDGPCFDFICSSFTFSTTGS